MKNIVVGLGEVLWDMLPTGKKLGGAPANFAFHASQFGLEGWVASCVGNDELGDEILDILHSKKLNIAVERVDKPTGRVEVTFSGDGIPEYEICEDVAWDNILYTNELEALAKQVKCVVFGSLAQRSEPSRSSIQKFLTEVASSEDTMRIFDINIRQNFYTKEVVEESLQLCNILKINDEELPLLASLVGVADSGFDQMSRTLMQSYSLDIVILTCGAKESFIFYKGAVSHLPTPKVNAVDTVGAGDSFTASFAASLIKGLSVEQAHSKAVAVAAYVCTQQGAMPELPMVLTAI